MSVITAKGSEAKQNAEKSSMDLSKVYLRLKDGESHKVRILHADDYVEYNAVGDYNNGIFNQPVNDESPLLKAHKEGGDKFKDMYPRKRYAFVFGSLETGDLVAFDASRNQAKALIATIEEYKENLGENAFTFKRVGQKTSTVYSLSPMLKMDKETKEVFDTFEDKEVEMEYYEKILQPNSPDFLVKLLTEIDPGVLDLFPNANIDQFDGKGNSEESKNEDDVTDISDDDLPF